MGKQSYVSPFVQKANELASKRSKAAKAFLSSERQKVLDEEKGLERRMESRRARSFNRLNTSAEEIESSRYTVEKKNDVIQGDDHKPKFEYVCEDSPCEVKNYVSNFKEHSAPAQHFPIQMKRELNSSSQKPNCRTMSVDIGTQPGNFSLPSDRVLSVSSRSWRSRSDYLMSGSSLSITVHNGTKISRSVSPFDSRILNYLNHRENKPAISSVGTDREESMVRFVEALASIVSQCKGGDRRPKGKRSYAIPMSTRQHSVTHRHVPSIPKVISPPKSVPVIPEVPPSGGVLEKLYRFRLRMQEISEDDIKAENLLNELNHVASLRGSRVFSGFQNGEYHRSSREIPMSSSSCVAAEPYDDHCLSDRLGADPVSTSLHVDEENDELFEDGGFVVDRTGKPGFLHIPTISSKPNVDFHSMDFQRDEVDDGYFTRVVEDARVAQFGNGKRTEDDSAVALRNALLEFKAKKSVAPVDRSCATLTLHPSIDLSSKYKQFRNNLLRARMSKDAVFNSTNTSLRKVTARMTDKMLNQLLAGLSEDLDNLIL